MISKKVQEKTEYYIQFTDDECEELNLKVNQKYSMEIEGDSIKMKPYCSVDIDISEFSRETLEHLVQESARQDVSVNIIIENSVENYFKKHITCLK